MLYESLSRVGKIDLLLAGLFRGANRHSRNIILPSFERKEDKSVEN